MQALLNGDTPYANTPEAAQGLALIRPLQASARQGVLRYIEHTLVALGHPEPKAWLLEAALGALRQGLSVRPLQRNRMLAALDVLAQTMSACDPQGARWKVVHADARGARLEMIGALASGPYVLAAANTESGKPEWHCKASLQLWWRDHGAMWVFEDRAGHVKAGTLTASQRSDDAVVMVSALMRWHQADNEWRLMTLKALASWSPRAEQAHYGNAAYTTTQRTQRGVRLA